MKVSILVPLFNTPKQFLKEMLESVFAQTYSNWELCLADASSDDTVGKLVREIAKGDERVKYKRLESNGGISANSNAALELATGEIIALLDHDDKLDPDAVKEVARAIEEEGADFAYTDEVTFISETGEFTIYADKPDFDPFMLLVDNYLCHFSAFRRSLLDKLDAAFRSEFDGSQDHDLFLRLTEKASKVVHVPKTLYYWRAHKQSVAKAITAKSYAVIAGHAAVSAALERRGLSGTVESPKSDAPSFYHIRFDLPEKKRVSIIIPTRDHMEDLRKCIESIFAKTTYPDYEIVIVDNGTSEPSAIEYLKEISRSSRVRVIDAAMLFNFSKLVNLGVEAATGEYVLLLNNDTEVITPEWLEEMVAFARLPEVGAVGAKLYYPDNTIQHAGVILGMGGIAGHAFVNHPREDPGVMGRMIVAHEYSAVTGACLMVRREVYREVGGFETEGLAVAFNDVDFCMRLREAGYHNVWTPFAELYHYESKSRGNDLDPDKIERFTAECNFFSARWSKEMERGDPFFHPALRLDSNSFIRRDQEIPAVNNPTWHKRLPKPLSKIIGGYYCLKENGWYYTYHHAWDKVGKKFRKIKYLAPIGEWIVRWADDPHPWVMQEAYSNRPRVYGENAAEVELKGEHKRESKRAAVIAMYTADGKVEPRQIELVKGVAAVAGKIVAYFDSLLEPEEAKKILPYVTILKAERHGEYDFGSYKRGYEIAEREGWVKEAEELIVLNDSCVGPVYPFEEAFEKMAKEQCDFWGQTSFSWCSRKHIQSYFYVFRRTTLESGAVGEFLSAVTKLPSKGDIIARYEVGFAEFLVERGFKWKTLVPFGKIPYNPCTRPLAMMRKYRAPLIKVKAFIGECDEDIELVKAHIRSVAPQLAHIDLCGDNCV